MRAVNLKQQIQNALQVLHIPHAMHYGLRGCIVLLLPVVGIVLT